MADRIGKIIDGQKEQGWIDWMDGLRGGVD